MSSVGRISFTIDERGVPEGSEEGGEIRVSFESFEFEEGSDFVGVAEFRCELAGELRNRVGTFLSWFAQVVDEGRQRLDEIETLWEESGGSEVG